jgi:hypothetical protein
MGQTGGVRVGNGIGSYLFLDGRKSCFCCGSGRIAYFIMIAVIELRIIITLSCQGAEFMRGFNVFVFTKNLYVYAMLLTY